MLEMKNRSISDYPEEMMEASCCLLYHSSLITPFLYIVFRKTNVYDLQESIASLNLIHCWMKTLYKNGKRCLHSSFDNDFFIKGMKIALDADLSVVVAKTL